MVSLLLFLRAGRGKRGRKGTYYIALVVPIQEFEFLFSVKGNPSYSGFLLDLSTTIFAIQM